MRVLEETVEGLGFCLSEEGDLLSQWRGYADDAYGVSIGFSTSYLRRLADVRKQRRDIAFQVQRVIYETSDHDAAVKPTFDQVKRHIDDGAYKLPDLRIPTKSITQSEKEIEGKRAEDAHLSLSVSLFPLILDLYRLKSSSFCEEREWRLLTGLASSGDSPSEFHSKRDRILPYRSYDLEDLGIHPIERLVIGAKHLTPPDLVRSFLARSGFRDVEVVKSDVPYR